MITIACLIDSLTPTQAAMLAGVRSYVDQHDLDWSLISVPAAADPEQSLGLQASAWPEFSGAILCPVRQLTWQRRFAAAGLPVVRLVGSEPDRYTAQPRETLIGTDDAAIGRLAARHVFQAGYRSGFIVAKDLDRPAVGTRCRAFLATCRDLGMATGNLIDEVPADLPDQMGAQAAWLTARREPTAFFLHQDGAAAWLRSFCCAHRIGTPDPIGIIGVDNLLARCEDRSPTLTSIDLGGHHRGVVVARCLHRLLADTGRAERLSLPPLRVVARESTALAPQLSPLVERALAVMRRHLADPLSVEALTAAFGCTHVTLWRAFKRELNHSPKSQQRLLRLQHAEHLLLTTNHSLAHIARACGFASSKSLGDAFSAYFGLPPKRFRSIARAGGQVR